jgi:hypothetical protein
LDSDGHIARRQPFLVHGLDPRSDLAALLVQHQRAEHRHG